MPARPLVGPLDGRREERERAAAAFERVDDVVMGGVSSSRIKASAQEARLVWTGQVRVDGGGFAGVRTRRLAAPLDLAAFDGLELDAQLVSDEEAERRTWKATLRAQDSRGEVVYQAPFVPAVGAPAPVRIPWSAFRLVRGPVMVPDVPPLGDEREKLTTVFGLGLIVSRFGPQGPMENFRAGNFSLALNGVGVYGGADDAEDPPNVADLASTEDSANRGNRTLVGILLAPLLKLVFSEVGRRRKQARTLLKRRYGMGELRARAYGQRLKAARLGALRAAVQGVCELLRDVASAALALPVRALFLLQARVVQAVRRVRGASPLPRMR